MRRLGKIQSKLIPETEPSSLEPEERISLTSSTGGQDSTVNSNSGLAIGQQQQQLRETAPKQKPEEQVVRNVTSAKSQQEFPKRRPANEDSKLIEESGETSSLRTLDCCCARSNMSKTSSLLMALFVAELIGTFILVVIGDGVIATYVLTKQPVNVFVSCFAFGVGCMIATFATSKISGAHLNPAASLAFALDGQLKWSLLPVYMLAQYMGGFLAALVLFVNNCEAINALDGGTRSAFGAANSTGHIFATYPGAWVSVWGSLLDQIIATAVLLFALSAISDKHNLALDDKHQPLIVSLVIGLVCVAFNPNCGAILNPARDLAPRILTSILGYPSVWSSTEGLYWLTAGVLGPHIGAILGLFTYRLMIGGALMAKRAHDLESTENLEMKQEHGCLHRKLASGRQVAGGGGGGGRRPPVDPMAMAMAMEQPGPGLAYGSAASRQQC